MTVYSLLSVWQVRKEVYMYREVEKTQCEPEILADPLPKIDIILNKPQVYDREKQKAKLER